MASTRAATTEKKELGPPSQSVPCGEAKEYIAKIKHETGYLIHMPEVGWGEGWRCKLDPGYLELKAPPGFKV